LTRQITNNLQLKEIAMAGKIPAGTQVVTPHLIIKGASRAMEFYKQAFGAEEVYRMPGMEGDQIMHAEMKVGDGRFFLCDEMPDYNALSPKTLGGSPVTIHLYVANCDETFNRAISAGATPVMPPDNMFWGDRYAKIADPFGHNWSIASQVEALSPDMIVERGREFMAKFAGEQGQA
jgi:uncharacterized glyoxalase superfamily protein PhnB